MKEIRIDLEIVCSCGKELEVKRQHFSGSIEIEPCKSCLEEAYDEGFTKGQDENAN